MSNEEKLKNLKIYIEKIEKIASEHLKERDITPLEAIKEALNYVEGEMQER